MLRTGKPIPTAPPLNVPLLKKGEGDHCQDAQARMSALPLKADMLKPKIDVS